MNQQTVLTFILSKFALGIQSTCIPANKCHNTYAKFLLFFPTNRTAQQYKINEVLRIKNKILGAFHLISC